MSRLFFEQKEVCAGARYIIIFCSVGIECILLFLPPLPDELEQYLAEQFEAEALAPPHINLLTDTIILNDPVFSITDYQTYSADLPITETQKRTLPPRFIIGFSYKPDLNTILRLFSIDVVDPPSLHSHTSSALLLSSSSLTLVYPRTFMVPSTNITHLETNDLLLFVNNGELSYCINGEYLPHVWNTNLWLHNVSTSEILLKFNEHLREAADRVSQKKKLEILCCF